MGTDVEYSSTQNVKYKYMYIISTSKHVYIYLFHVVECGETFYIICDKCSAFWCWCSDSPLACQGSKAASSPRCGAADDALPRELFLSKYVVLTNFIFLLSIL